MRCWVHTVSHDHVLRGVDGGFTQADHGKSTRLVRLARGDRLVFYSPRTTYPDGPPLQQFTAIGTVIDDKPYQVTMSEDFHPWRRRLQFDADTHPVDAKPLIGALSFIHDERRWGYPFRRGLFDVPCADLDVIERAMRAG